MIKQSKNLTCRIGMAGLLSIALTTVTQAAEQWQLTKLDDFIIGATVMAAGGGGSPTVSKELLTKNFSQSDSITLTNVSELPSSSSSTETAFVTGALGSPAVVFDLPDPLSLPYNVYWAAANTFNNKAKIDYLMPVEVGAINGLYSFLVANKVNKDLPGADVKVLNVEGGGRSVPTLPLLKYSWFKDTYEQSAHVATATSKIETAGSVRTPTEWGRFVAPQGTAQEQKDQQDRIENALLSLISGAKSPYAGATGYGSFFAKAYHVKQNPPVTGQLKVAQQVGAAYKTTPTGANVVNTLNANGRKAKVIFSGTVTSMTQSTTGIDFGEVVINGTGANAGDTFRIQYENENICAYKDSYSSAHPYVLGPDSVAFVPKDGTMFDNSDLYKIVNTQGLSPAVDIVGILVDDQVSSNPGMMEAWAKVLKAIPGNKCDFKYSSPWLYGVRIYNKAHNEAIVSNSAAGSQAVVGPATPIRNHSWKLGSNEPGYIEIISIVADQCLSVEGASTVDGAKIIYSDCDDSDQQKWKINDQGDGFFTLESKVSGKCMDVPGDKKLLQWSCHGLDHQKFDLAELSF